MQGHTECIAESVRIQSSNICADLRAAEGLRCQEKRGMRQKIKQHNRLQILEQSWQYLRTNMRALILSAPKFLLVYKPMA